MKAYATAAALTLSTLIISLAPPVFSQSHLVNASAQKPLPDTSWTIINAGANNNVWQKTTYEIDPHGTQRPHLHQYVELASGLNYLKNGRWIPSQEVIEPYSQGAIARQGQYQVIFANNLNTAGAVDLQAADGKRLRSNIIGLGYFDRSTGNSVLIAQLQDSTGQLITDNQVLYPNAFAGVNADVRYTYRKSGLEQDVILREQPPAPQSFGLNSETTELEVMTAFIDPPPANVTTADAGSQNLDPDQTIRWGTTVLGKGRAFDLSNQKNSRNHVSVSKQYVNVRGRQILLERVSLKEILPQLSSLPAQPSSQARLSSIVSKTLILPKLPVAQAMLKPIQLASRSAPDRGYVLDYVTISSPETNFVFQGDMTYYINGEYDLMGTTIIEGNSVIKLGGSGQIDIDQNGTVICKTAAYQPAVFTSANDNSLGESIGSGSPAFGDVYAFLNINATNVTLHDLRFAYGWIGAIQNPEPATLDVWNCQFIDGDCAVFGYNVGLHNILISRSNLNLEDAAVFVEGPSLVAENVTADQGNDFIEPDYSGAVLALTNCLVTSQSVIVPGFSPTLLTNSTVCIISPGSPVYQTVGAGDFYLTNGSPYRSYGTTNVTPALLTALRSKTTYPPTVYSLVVFPTNTVLAPQAPRDTNSSLDVGYHYDPLDYVFGGCDLSTNLTFLPGTAAGWYQDYGSVYSSGQPYGISLNDGADLDATGSTTAPCWIVNFITVQENGNSAWTSRGWMSGIMINGSGSGTAPQLDCSFTKWSEPPGLAGFFRDNWAYGVVGISDNEFYSGGMNSYWGPQYFTNCLFQRTGIAFWDQIDAPAITFQNCTFYCGCLAVSRTSSQSQFLWLFKNNAFDGTAFAWTDDDNGNTNFVAMDYNAYNTNNLSWQTYPFPYPPVFGTLEDVGPHDQFVTNYNWQSSWFGNYYLPANSVLVNAGSTTANQLGLYHFTTQTNQVPETNSVVDIGYHYVATDQHGNPVDSNNDGVPDYLEDANGDGLVDNGETNWALAILIQPVSQAVFSGTNVAFSVLAAGTPSISYQWQKNGTNLTNGGNVSGANSSSLALSNVSPADTGLFSVIVSNSSGSFTSCYAALRVWTASSIVTWGGTGGFLQNGGGIPTGLEEWDYYGGTNVPPGLNNVVAIASGGYWGVALNGDGTTIGWGSLEQENYGEPNPIFYGPSDLTNAVAIASATWNAVALKSDGTLEAWNYPGSFYSVSIPPGISNIVAIAAGYNDYFALKNDGTIIAWGDSGYSGGSDTNVPAGLSNVIAIAAAMALEANGTVITWGSSSPTPGGLTNVISIGAGINDHWAVKSNGTLAVWGSSAHTNVPAGLTNVVAAAAGWYEMFATKSDGTVVSWGISGPPGPYNSSYYDQTIVPPGLVNVAAVSAGRWHCLALGTLAPCPIANFIATGTTPYQLNLQWTATSGGITSFDLERKSGNSAYQPIATVSGSTTSYLDTSVYCTNQYSYRIKAIYSSGQSGYSTEISPPTVSLTVNTTNAYFIVGTSYPLTEAVSETYTAYNLEWIVNSTISIADLNDGSINQASIVNALNVSNVLGSASASAYNFYINYTSGSPQYNGSAVLISLPYTYNWTPASQGIQSLMGIATDSSGNTWVSPILTMPVYQSSGGTGVPDVVEVQNGNNPLNPWTPPSGDTNTTPPSINLLVPANAKLQ